MSIEILSRPTVLVLDSVDPKTMLSSDIEHISIPFIKNRNEKSGHYEEIRIPTVSKKVTENPSPLYTDIKNMQSPNNVTSLKPVPSITRVLDPGPSENHEKLTVREDTKLKLLNRRRRTYADDDDDDTDTLNTIGTRIDEKHKNYQLTCNMLAGIRNVVGEVCAKMKKPLTDSDFTFVNNKLLDMVRKDPKVPVNSKVKFKDYAPWVFRNLREKFRVDAADYLLSLTNHYILSEIGSPGKSGSFFYYSKDYRFIIKTIHPSEHKFMRKILKEYYQHVTDNPNTLLCRFYGLHLIKLPKGKNTHFVIMGNVLPPNKDIHHTFDLKGSLFGRLTPEDEVNKTPNTVMKDLNWLQREEQIHLGPNKRKLFLEQLDRDIAFLKRLNIMDYSLLVGIHDIKKGNTECIRNQSLHMVNTGEDNPGGRSNRLRYRGRSGVASKVSTTTSIVTTDVPELPSSPSEERRWCIFYADDGGFRSSNEKDEPSDKLYYIGIIDILTPYNFMKRSEHFWKSITQDKNTISAVHPKIYGKRFLNFIMKAVSGAVTKPSIEGRSK